jgi:endonuclease/exonuclease/phosphatase family metal-dependent hydrolase
VTALGALSVASLNLHGGRDNTGTPYSVPAAVRLLSADVVVLQENWRPRNADSLARRAAAECGYYEVAELDVLNETTLYDLGVTCDASAHESGAWGLAMLSRVPMVGREELWLGTAPGDMSARAAQIVEVGECGGAALRLVNVHLTNRLRYGPGQLRRLLRTVAPQRVPTVLVGDFNMCRPAIYMARGYRAAIRGRTWPARRPAAQLDHVLVGPGIDVVRAQVEPAVGSDHLPVRVVLHVPHSESAQAR